MSRPFPLILPAALAAFACQTVGGPDDVALRYARALAENRLDDAYALTSKAQQERVSREAFSTRYSGERDRQARAEEILAGVGTMRARAGTLEATREPEGWRVAELPPAEAPRQVLERFVAAVDARDFDAAYGLLAPAWRARYTPARLKADFTAEPTAPDRVERLRAALDRPLTVTADGAELPLGDGRAVRLLREAQSYTVVSLE